MPCYQSRRRQLERNWRYVYEIENEETAMNKTMRFISFAAICAIFAACASLGKQGPIAKGPDTTVVVDNRASLDMNIYIVRDGGQRIRLGTANALSTTKLTIPKGIILGPTEVRFLADPIGSSHTPISEVITVNEGDEVGLTLPPF